MRFLGTCTDCDFKTDQPYGGDRLLHVSAHQIETKGHEVVLTEYDEDEK